MRNLILLRGAPGCGKSTWIRENSLQQYTLCADEIRTMFQSPILDLKGNEFISPKNDTDVWKLLFEILERRMGRGELTIIDATHSRSATINQYRNLCRQYRYRCYVIDFTDISIEETKRRNINRISYKIVPEEVIDLAYSRFKLQPVPGWVVKLSREEFFSQFKELKIYDFNEYEKVIIFGDIHSCIDPVNLYFRKNPFNDSYMYIFIGDYFDRGYQHIEVLEFLETILDKKNILLLHGNHEDHLGKFVEKLESRSDEFERYTKPSLILSDGDAERLRKRVRILYNKISQLAYYTYREKIYLVNHGGVPTLITPFTSTQEFVKGVGKYEHHIEIANSWNENTPLNYYQIHGHRNVFEVPIENGRVFNLCDEIEFGGYLRILTLNSDGSYETTQIKNTSFDPEARRKFSKPAEKLQEEISESNYLEILRKSKFVRESVCYTNPNISSFNFTRSAFLNKKWDSTTVKARGLFINTLTGLIVARSYNKFFNLGEREETKLENLNKVMEFPINLYKKENGYLGLISYDTELYKLFTSTKSSDQGNFVEWFRGQLNSEKYDLDLILKFVGANRVTMVCEVVDPINDPHIIEYKNSDIFLLDVIDNKFDFEKMPYWTVKESAIELGFNYKKESLTFNDYYSFYKWYSEEFNHYSYTLSGENIEGFVIEGKNGYMIKIKSPYYSFWKFWRSQKDYIARGRPINTAILSTALSNDFYGFLIEMPREEIAYSNIIQLRNKFEGK